MFSFPCEIIVFTKLTEQFCWFIVRIAWNKVSWVIVCIAWNDHKR